MKIGRLFIASIFALGLLAVVPDVHADETVAAKVTQDYQSEMERLRLLAASNADQFAAASADLRSELEKQIGVSEESAVKSDKLADRYRRLAAAAEAAARDRQRAAQTSEDNAKEFKDGDSFKALLLESAQNDRISATEAQDRADSRRKLAVEWRGRAEQQRARVAALRAQIAALERLATVPDTAPQPAAAPQPEAPENTLEALFNPEDGAHPGFEVADVLGLWRPKSGPQFPMAIVQKRPGDEAFPYDLQIHTSGRVWEATFTGFPAGDIGRSQQARIVATYTPQPAEMNPDIPDWVTAIIDGHLKWRLEIDETGSLFDPKLRVKWYRGEVRWTEGEDRTAWVEGDGVPLVYEMEFEPLIDVTLGQAAVLWLEPVERRGRVQVGANPTETDYVAKRITDLIKHQPFKIKVKLPIELAKERGPKLTVKIEGLKGGDTNEFELIGPTVTRITTGNRGIVYTHSGEVTLADYGSEPTRNPQFMSLGHLAQNWTRSMDAGKRLDLSLANGEEVKFSYDGAAQSIHLWDTHIRHGLALHERTLATHLAQADETIRDSNQSNALREAAVKRWRLLKNYQTLVAREDLLEIHKYYLGELYLTKGIGGANIICTGDECQTMPLRNPIFKVPPAGITKIAGLASVPDGEPAYFTSQIELYVEILTGEKKTPAALRVRNAVNWVNQGEADLVALALKGASDKARTQFQNTVADIAYAIPRGLTEDVHIALYAKNLKDKPVSKADRQLTITKFFVDYLMNKGAAFTSRGIVRLRQRALSPVGNRAMTRALLHGADAGAAAASTRVVRDLDASTDATVRQAVQDLPDSVTPGQTRQLAVALDDDAALDGDIVCRNRDVDTVIAADGGNAWSKLIQEALDEEAAPKPLRLRQREVRRAYRGHPGVKVEEIDVFARQKGGTCAGASTAYAMREMFGDHITLDGVINGIAENLHSTTEKQIQRARQKVRRIQDRLIENTENGRPTAELIEERDIALKQLKRVEVYRDNSQALKELNEKIEFLEGNSVKTYHAAEAVVREGGQVAVLRPIDAPRLKLRHLRTLKKRDYQVVVAINRGDAVDHAVVITKFEMKDGQIHRVHWFDPAHDAILSAPAKTFDNMIARREALTTKIDVENNQSVTTVAQPIVLAYRAAGYAE
ncbi:hypothetical protein N6L24_05790 [Cognatishimia sp. SS12]|uniref:hypothetical protein n=1 Tax=Cognatishimia sp. SS12 TaxID=2979465 RepID=UPI00232DCFFD|nr:hypothetical protein [Cognatishimia sp. SS12]MDC0737781.1 hypothetical protein [Cognatishimia sp. SS12]